MSNKVKPASLLTDEDIYIFKEGRHFHLYEKLGSHPMKLENEEGTLFAVWAPNAREVSVIGDFNGWDRHAHILKPRWDESGIWEGFIPNVGKGAIYKYFIRSNHKDFEGEKGDPFGLVWEIPPKTASVVWDTTFDWSDESWIKKREAINRLDQPINVYELHFASWRRVPEEGNRSLTYREMAKILPNYLIDLGFTHVQFLPLMEHPFQGSWGYQKVGYFAPSSRYGTPQDFMYLIDELHRNGIGVFLDWVPSHFPSDSHGLAYFDGTHLYEHEDRKKGFHPDWKSYIFNYGRPEVRAFLISSAIYWFEKYHIDGLRVDAVASMLYLDYSRKEGEWIPNPYGGNENLEAIEFLKQLNEAVYHSYPYVQMIAEESTSWPMVSRPTYLGGLGFGMKWNMGWMHDTLQYFSENPVNRKYHHNELLFSLNYAFTENFLLPFSHDEVVHGKGSLIGKMPGDDWQKFANLRLLFGYMYAHPGKKLLFMGSEIGGWSEWNHDTSLEWDLLEHAPHQGIFQWIKDLNTIYRKEPSLYALDFVPEGFEWVDLYNWEESIISFLRKSPDTKDQLLIICNFTPVPRENYKIGVDQKGQWQEILNSDSKYYGGSNMGNVGRVHTRPLPCYGRDHTLKLTLPPLSILILKPVT
ncbi:MAG: 1,4-alpha-glucan branching protein GlgB [Waddliaceae bacterium]